MGVIEGGLVIGNSPRFSFADPGSDTESDAGILNVGFDINQEVLAGKKAFRQGALRVVLNRADGQPDTVWDGNPDAAVNIQATNRSNQTIGGAVRGMSISSRNRGTNINWVEGINLGVRNDSGKQVAGYVKGIQVRVENYGNIADDILGIDVELSDENSNVDPHTKTGVRIRNTDASGMGAVDRVLRISHTSTNGFTNFLSLGSATGDTYTAKATAVASLGSTLGYLLVDINGTPGRIPVFDTWA